MQPLGVVILQDAQRRSARLHRCGIPQAPPLEVHDGDHLAVGHAVDGPAARRPLEMVHEVEELAVVVAGVLRPGRHDEDRPTRPIDGVTHPQLARLALPADDRVPLAQLAHTKAVPPAERLLEHGRGLVEVVVPRHQVAHARSLVRPLCTGLLAHRLEQLQDELVSRRLLACVS